MQNQECKVHSVELDYLKKQKLKSEEARPSTLHVVTCSYMYVYM